MQKKINILASLLVIAIVLGGLSPCTRGSFREGFRRGTEEGLSAYEAGKQAGENVREKIVHEHSVDLHLLPKDYQAFPQTLLNTKTGELMQVSLQEVRVGFDKESDEAGSWPENLLSTLAVILLFVVCIGGSIAFVLLLFVLITSIKSGSIFVKGNEKVLRWMGTIMLAWYVTDWIYTLSGYLHAKSIIALEDYTVLFEAPGIFSLVLGFTLLLFAQIFAKGRKMEEDQEFMV